MNKNWNPVSVDESKFKSKITLTLSWRRLLSSRNQSIVNQSHQAAAILISNQFKYLSKLFPQNTFFEVALSKEYISKIAL